MITHYEKMRRKLIDPPKSEPSLVDSVVWFMNGSSRDVDVYWLNYEGVPVLYKTLQPTTFFKARTFVGHPWIAVDGKTHDRLLLQSEFVYYPKTIDKPLEPGCETTRWSAKIQFPVPTLRSCCLQLIVNILYSKPGVLNLNELRIPCTLKDEIIQVMVNRAKSFIELYEKDCTIGLPLNLCNQ